MRCIEVLKFVGSERVERVAYTPSGRFGNQEPLDPALLTRAGNDRAAIPVEAAPPFGPLIEGEGCDYRDLG